VNIDGEDVIVIEDHQAGPPPQEDVAGASHRGVQMGGPSTSAPLTGDTTLYENQHRENI